MSILGKFGQFFGLGRVPEKLRKELAAEGLLLLAEGLPATVLFRDYKGPGSFASSRITLFFGFVAISERRFVAYASAYNEIDVAVPFEHPKFAELSFSATKKHLLLDYDAARFTPDSSGRVTIRFRLSDPESALSLLKRKGAKAV